MAERLYSLFRNMVTPTGKRRYERVAGAGAYSRQAAVRIFQDRLLGSAFSAEPLEIRPVSAVKSSPLPASENMCGPCAAHLHTKCVKTWCQCNCRMFDSALPGDIGTMGHLT